MMGAIDHQAAAQGSHPAWGPLDDALQILVRAESIMMLLQCAFDVEEHHRYGAQIACDELRSLKQKITAALAQIRPARRRRTAPKRSDRTRPRKAAGSVPGAAVARPGI